MATYALVDAETGKILSRVEWDGDEKNWKPPEGCKAVEVTEDNPIPLGATVIDGEVIPDSDPDFLAKVAADQAASDEAATIVDLAAKLEIGTASNEEVQQAIFLLMDHCFRVKE